MRAAPTLPPGLGPALAAASDRAGVGFVVSPHGGLRTHLYVSPAAARLLGFDVDELARLGPADYLDAAVLAELASAEPGPVTRDAFLKRRDGSDVHARVSRTVSEGDRHDVYVFHDAPGRAHGELQRARAEFQRLLDAAPDGVAVLGRHGLLYANPVLLRWVGFSDVARLARARLAEVIHTHDVEAASQGVRSLLDVPESRSVVRIRVRRPGGGLFDVECLGLATEWEGERACLVVARDLSQRRMDQSRYIVADRGASVGTMSAGVAHEINNPLAYLLLNLEYLIRELPQAASSPAELRHLSERLAESRHGAERVGHILKELSSLSSRRRTRRLGVDLVDVVRRALRVADRELAPRGRVVVDDQGAPCVDADPNSLEQLFVNVLCNAAQALPATRASDSEVTIRLRTSSDGDAVVEIADNGKGIAPEHLNRVFDPFFTTKASGTGLGLPISHAIVSSFDGQITVESELGKGTTFQISLPRGTIPRSEVAPISSGPAPAARRARVLVVDDDTLVAETMSRVLAETYDVRVCTSAQEALSVLGADSGFDVILCDLLMPDMSGMDLHAALAESQPGLEQRLVFMTGGAFTQRASDFLRRVGNPRLEKPFELGQLHAIVGERLAEEG